MEARGTQGGPGGPRGKPWKEHPGRARGAWRVQGKAGHTTNHFSFMMTGHMDPFWKHGAQHLADAKVGFRCRETRMKTIEFLMLLLVLVIK